MDRRTSASSPTSPCLPCLCLVHSQVGGNVARSCDVDVHHAALLAGRDSPRLGSHISELAELGDCRRFDNSRDAVRYGGMDITVYQSDRHRAPGHLSRQGPPALRWALYEAAQHARFPNSPDREYYLKLKAAERLGGNRACLALARKLLKRCYHTLRELGEDAIAPPDQPGSGSARRASSGSPHQTKRPATTHQPTDALAA